jgi:phage terminase large subunit-like protein
MALHPDGVEMCGGALAAVAATAKDVRETLVEGASGLLATAPHGVELKYNEKRGIVTYPNGSKIHLYSAEKPDRMRGPNVSFVWCDEIPHWKYPQNAWDQVQLMSRLGKCVKMVVTTTPLPTPFMRKLARDPTTRVVHGSTFDNRGNLAPNFIRKMRSKYGKTRLGRQELEGEILEDVKGALWQQQWIKRKDLDDCPEFVHVAISIDPAGGSTHKKSDRTGITVQAIDDDARLYVLDDQSDRISSKTWGLKAIRLAKYWLTRAGKVTIVGEKNFGGDMVQTCIELQPEFQDIKHEVDIEIITAIKSKGFRATPVAQHYESGYAYHVDSGIADRGDGLKEGRFLVLEHQMTTFDPVMPRKDQVSDDEDIDWKSPDNMDALVHGATYLLTDDDGYFRTPGVGEAMAEVLDDLDDDEETVDHDDWGIF